MALFIVLGVAAILAATVILIIRGVMAGQSAENEAYRLREERRGAGPFVGLIIRPLGEGDKAAWLPLWDGYCDFYEEDVPQPVTDTTWARILDTASPVKGFGAFDAEGRLLGFAHIVLHPHTWSAKTVCYLEDLFVLSSVRGRDVGHSLINFLWKKSEAEGWARLYWHTATNNETARKLYDRFRPADQVVRYTIDVMPQGKRGLF